MKKYAKMFLMGATALFVASCSDADFESIFTAPGRTVTLQASIESSGTRAAIDAATGKTLWQTDDAIAIRLSDNSKLEMTVNDESVGKSSATFEGTIVGSAKLNFPTVGVYPYGNHTLTKGSISINMPKTYTVTDNDNTHMPMICEFGEDGKGTFKHLGGVMQFTIGMDNIPTAKKFVLTAADGKKITGKFNITTVDGKNVIEATAGDGLESTVTIEFNSKQVNSDNELTVNVPLPVGEYVGLKLDILDATDKKLMKTFSSSVTNTVGRANRVVMPKITPVAVSAGTEVSGGVEKVDDTHYTFTAPEAFTWLAEQVNTKSNDFEGVTITLTENVTIPAGTTWTPIASGARSGNGSTGNAFKGTFDGNGKTISGLAISGGSKDDALGLFGVVDGGTVKNLTLEGVSINSPDCENAGGVSGLLTNGGTIENVKVYGTISAKRGNGGIAGRVLVEGTIKDCENHATIIGTSTNVGGIVGAAYYTAEGKTMTIEGCTNNGTVTGAGYVGGIAGLSSAVITGCKNTAAVHGTSSTGVGGIIGEQSNAGSVHGCTNSGSVTNDADVYGTGGIVGWIRYAGETSAYPAKNTIEVDHNTNSASVKGGKGVGGIVGVAYSYGNIHDNINTAASLEGSTFVAGVVGDVQNDLHPGIGTDEDWHVYVKNNKSTTKASQMTAGSCQALYVYINTPDHTTATGNYGAEENNVADNKAQVNGVEYETIEAALAANPGKTEVKLGKGDYALPSNLSGLTITGVEGETEVDWPESGNPTAYNNVTIENVTFNMTGANYKGFQHAENVTFKNCTFNGLMFGYGNSETYINCKFYQTIREYHMWTYGANAVYDGCYFEGNGKFLHLYNEMSASNCFNVVVRNCHFKSTSAAADKAALVVKGSNSSFNVTIENCTTEGLFKTTNDPNGLWMVDKLGSATLNITVDGTKVYPTE